MEQELSILSDHLSSPKAFERFVLLRALSTRQGGRVLVFSTTLIKTATI
jgi:hypothetical protein